MKRSILCVVILICSMISSNVMAAPYQMKYDVTHYQMIMTKEAEFIQGLSENEIPAGQSYVLAYINWYISHMNTVQTDVNGLAGTVYDYVMFIDPTDDSHIIEVTYMDAYNDATRNYDSTDSYAATFLELLCSYTEHYDHKFLDDKKQLVEVLIQVISATRCDGLYLTGAKPDYMVCYLMDNCEVYQALNRLSKHYSQYQNEAQRVQEGIMQYMSSDNGYFYPAVDEEGNTLYDMSDRDHMSYYPEATSQLFPITFGVIDSATSLAKSQYKFFNMLYGRESVAGRDWTAIDTGTNMPGQLIYVEPFK